MTTFKRPSLSLLAATTPSLVTTIRTKCKINPTKFLQLRSDTLLIFNKRPLPDLSNASQVIPIAAEQPPLQRSSKTVAFARQKFSFSSPADADAFRLALLTAISRRSYSSARPSIGHLTSLPSSTSNTITHALETQSSASSRASSTSSLSSRPQLLSVKKISKHDAFLSSTSLKRIVHERVALELAAKSGSPFFSRMRHAFETKDALNIVTEAPELGDLDRLLSKLPKKRLAEEPARQLFAEIVLALEDVHKLGLLFRNMNPQNIHLTSAGHIRLLDFGLAKCVGYDRSSKDSFTSSFSSSTVSSEDSDSEAGSECLAKVGRTRSFVGKRSFMSPEHVSEEDGSYGAPADVWALGATLYTMVSGRPPFKSSTKAASLFNRIANDNVRMLSSLSDDLKTLLRGLLEKDECVRLTIEEIKESEWMKDIDWNKVRLNASSSVENEEILNIVREADLERLDDVILKSSDDDAFELDENLSETFSQRSTSEETPKWSSRRESSLAYTFKKLKPPVRKRKNVSDASDAQLLGFSFNLEEI